MKVNYLKLVGWLGIVIGVIGYKHLPEPFFYFMWLPIGIGIGFIESGCKDD